MKVFTVLDKEFEPQKYKELFETYKDLINDDNVFEDIIGNTLFYAFYTDDNKFICCIYFYLKEDGNLYLNAYGQRKMHTLNIEALKKTFDWFNCDIYAKTPHKTASLCLLRTGFKKIGNELYIKKKGDSHGL